ncbi:Oidioi.mRNA.OKI2018_I69.PAR.g8736.t1.cds [Oikopleura dioica]|uniref:beta-mannosidase n=1 Tax=Oikopleura dioica TaxID=34765 RepID=A0ABN7RHC6_OIKDI|nr:Oidioi.mRNA.OKI2018_I69.PAR.g8736.t1.cds [Oikopleura dioica]
MVLLISLFIVISICSGYSISSAKTSNLTFTAQKKLHSCTSLTPISIYSCYLSKFPEENINYRTNDAKLQWIGNTRATYEAEIDASSTSKFAFLELRSIDTVGEIFWNGEKIGHVANSFRRYLLDVSSRILPKNHLQIDLSPPISSAKKLAEKDQIPQFPECPVPAQTNGQCHINMLRKAQYSFSWDWGPSLPDSGINEEPKLISFDFSMIYDAKLNLLTKYSDVQQTVQLQLLILHPNSKEAPNGEIQVSFEPSLPFDLGEIIYEKFEGDKNLWKATADLSISIMDINWWWPHEMGKQDLYSVQFSWIPEKGEKSTIEKEFGFRSVELVQEQLPDGRSFYFKINEKPIFMSGSNWIPSASSIASFDNLYEDNLQSAVEAGIKILRVWGGGIYEQDAFYSLANRLGIMIWQDFMFTCSTYENDSEFLNSVEKEVSDQIWRLSSNPSVIAWAGNNENEAALATNWWSIPEEKMNLYFGQYRDLYTNTIQNTVIKEGLSSPFFLSSPSNGKESELSPFGIAKNPYDPNYGDVHFYDYKSDCTDWRNFPKTRFASEFGYQD